MSRARTTPQMSRCTHGFRLQITLLNLSHRVPTPSVEPGTLPMDLLLQLENTYGPDTPKMCAASNQRISPPMAFLITSLTFIVRSEADRCPSRRPRIPRRSQVSASLANRTFALPLRPDRSLALYIRPQLRRQDSATGLTLLPEGNAALNVLRAHRRTLSENVEPAAFVRH